MFQEMISPVSSDGGGTTHIESTFGGSGISADVNSAKVSNDGDFTLATYSGYTVTLLKKCTVMTRVWGGTADVSVQNAGYTISATGTARVITLIDDQ